MSGGSALQCMLSLLPSPELRFLSRLAGLPDPDPLVAFGFHSGAQLRQYALCTQKNSRTNLTWPRW
jgi:hypothetical protein